MKISNNTQFFSLEYQNIRRLIFLPPCKGSNSLWLGPASEYIKVSTCTQKFRGLDEQQHTHVRISQ